jgi:hypothetical protein
MLQSVVATTTFSDKQQKRAEKKIGQTAWPPL